jgi:(5-formylfuran-3-yl)methyl phosphate synthase
MKLLVSVRSRGEVTPALNGGAEIIDAKEPRLGSLGPVDSSVLGDIAAAVPESCTFSGALGDCKNSDEVRSAITSRELQPRSAPQYMKVGFAGVREHGQVATILATAVETSALAPGKPGVIAVAYADAARAMAIDPWLIIALAKSAGAVGVLLDTSSKNGRSLLTWFSAPDLHRWVQAAQEAGLLSAVAGSLSSADIETVVAADPDIIGIRGAACTGGRNGCVSEFKVREFHRGVAKVLGSRAVGHSA